jgi:hypothetical protein
MCWRLFFAGLIKNGSIEIETAQGHKFTGGDGSGTKLWLRFNDKAAPAFLMLDTIGRADGPWPTNPWVGRGVKDLKAPMPPSPGHLRR